MVELPNFLICGGVASGTSFLSSALAQHPEIYLPRHQRPEPNFFYYSERYEKGLSWYRETLFADVSGQTAVGERSSLLFNSRVALERIAEVLPDVKLIVCLRSPIERAWANYRFTCLEGLETLSFKDAIAQEQERMQTMSGMWAEVQPYAYVTRSKYEASLLALKGFFSEEQILILSSETMNADSAGSLAKVCEFLGVAKEFEFQEPKLFSSPNVINLGLQAELRHYFGTRFSSLVESVRREDESAPSSSTEEEARKLQLLKDNLTAKKQMLDDRDRETLRAELRADIDGCRRLLDFSIDHWG